MRVVKGEGRSEGGEWGRMKVVEGEGKDVVKGESKGGEGRRVVEGEGRSEGGGG